VVGLFSARVAASSHSHFKVPLLSSLHALLHKAILGRTGQRLALRANRLAFAGGRDGCAGGSTGPALIYVLMTGLGLLWVNRDWAGQAAGPAMSAMPR
jgi:hypothetical protein